MPVGSLVLVRPPRLAGLVHQPFTSGIFSIAELQGIAAALSRAGNPSAKAIACVQRCCLDREDRPAKAGMQNVALDRVLEVRAVGANDPGWIGRRLNELRRDRVAGGPQLRRLVIYRIGAAQDVVEESVAYLEVPIVFSVA